MSLLGLDHGEKRIGVAVSDRLLIIAQASGFIENTGNEEVLEKINNIVKERDVDKIIIGLPIKLDGTDSPQTEKVRDFIEFLKENLNITIEAFDERFTSVSAERILISSGMKRKKRKKKIDGLAAQIMLQNYMDGRKK